MWLPPMAGHAAARDPKRTYELGAMIGAVARRYALVCAVLRAIWTQFAESADAADRR